MNYTLGPYEVQEWYYENFGERFVICTKNDAIARVEKLYRKPNGRGLVEYLSALKNEERANANLLAAAPELLNALNLGLFLKTIPAIHKINNMAIKDFFNLAETVIQKAINEGKNNG